MKGPKIATRKKMGTSSPHEIFALLTPQYLGSSMEDAKD